MIIKIKKLGEIMYKQYNHTLTFHEETRAYDITKEVNDIAVKAGELYAKGKISKWRFNKLLKKCGA
jgi:hypothetical protein